MNSNRNHTSTHTVSEALPDKDNYVAFEWFHSKVILLIVGTVIYFNSLFSPFIWDDQNQIVNNYVVHTIYNIPQFFLGSTFTPENNLNLSGLYYKPLLSTIFSFVYSLFGTNTFYFHSLQVGIHIANSMIVFIFFRRIFKEKTAFILSLIFLIHPINVEAVSYISALQEPLFFIFGMFALVIYQKKQMTKKYNVLVGFLLLCSILSKETGALFSIIIFSYSVFFKRAKLLPTMVICFIPIIIYSFLRFFIAKIYFLRIPDVPMMTATLWERLFTMPAIFLFYIKSFFFPTNFLIAQQWAVLSPTKEFYAPLLIDIFLFLIIFGIGYYIWKKGEYILVYLFFLLWFILGILFHIQILPLDMTVADRWFYFPMVGLLGMFGVIGYNVKSFIHRFRVLVYAVIAIIIIFLCIRTIMRNTDWWSGIALYSHNLQSIKDDRMEDSLATELFKSGRVTEARVIFEDLLKKNPSEPALYINLAVIYEVQGNLSKAKEMYKAIINMDGTGDGAYNLARILLIKEGNATQAEKVLKMYIVKYPLNGNLWVLLALSDYKLGNKQNALNDITRAKQLISNAATDQVYNLIINNQPMP